AGARRLNTLMKIDLTPEGRPRILVSSTEFGQGTNTILSQVCAQTLRIPYDEVLVAQPDTFIVPNSGPTVASRTAMIVGKLVERASEKLLTMLAPYLASDSQSANTPLPSTNASLSSFRSAAEESASCVGLGMDYAPDQFRRAALAYLADHGSLVAEARYEAPGNIFWDDDQYKGDAYPTYAWAVYVAEVAAHTLTSSAPVTNSGTVQAVGNIMHPAPPTG